MKIVAQIDEEKFFVEIDADEIALMYGFASKWDHNMEVGVGDEIPVTEVIQSARILKGLDSNRIARILQELERATETVQGIQEATQALTLFDKIKDAE